MLDPRLYPKADERNNAVQVPAAVIYDDERLQMELPRKFAAILGQRPRQRTFSTNAVVRVHTLINVRCGHSQNPWTLHLNRVGLLFDLEA